MKAIKFITCLIMLSNFLLLNAQDLPHHIPSSRSDELNVYFIYQLAECPESCDVEVAAVVEGGQPPYYYTWSNGETTSEIYDQCVGKGYITVTDDLGNSTTGKYAIDAYPVPVLALLDSMYFTITQPSGGQNNGSIAVDSSFVLDPNGLYLDSVWSIDGINFTIYHIFSHLGPGVYHLYVRTVQGCAIPVGEFILYDITSLENLITNFNLFPNPVTDVLQLTSDIPLTADLIDMNGKTLFVSEAKRFHQILMSEYPEGIYIVRISDGEKFSYRRVIKVSY